MSTKKPHIEVLARGVLIKQGRLLVCQTKGAAVVYLPGGHIEFMESASGSLCREVDEEMGLKAAIGHFLGAIEHSFIQQGEPHCEINLIFLMKVHGLRPHRVPKACEDHIRFRWLPIRRVKHSRLEPAPLRTLLPEWLKLKQVHHRVPRHASTL